MKQCLIIHICSFLDIEKLVFLAENNAHIFRKHSVLFNLAFFYHILHTIKAEFLQNWELNACFLTNNSKI